MIYMASFIWEIIVNPLGPKQFIEQLCQKNGGNSDKDVTIANALTRDIQTSFTSPGCFINELMQNADDQATDNSSEISFSLHGKELIVYHNGKPFDRNDVEGISSYGNTDDNRKKDDKEKSGFKDIGFKSVFRIAYRVDIWSQDWHFRFDEKNPKWGGDRSYPWQIAPIWTEKNELSLAAQESVSIERRTTFIFQLREGNSVKEGLERLKLRPEHILFLKKIRKVEILLEGLPHRIIHKDDEIYLNDKLHSSWARIDETHPLPLNIKNFLKQLSSQACPSRLSTGNDIVLSFSYPFDDFVPSIHLYSTLPTAVNAGFPFLINAPFLLNPSREALIENEWNIFLIQQIAILNFKHVKESIFKNANALKFLALPKIDGVGESIRSVFQIEMERLLANEPFLPPEFGDKLIKLNECEIDQTGLYRILHDSGVVLEDGPPYLVRADIDRSQILLRNPKVKQLHYKDIVAKLPELLEMKSKDLTDEMNIQVIRLLFDLFKKNQIPKDVLKSFRAVYLLTKSGQLDQCFKLCLPNSYQPHFSFETHFSDYPDFFISEKYAQPGEEKDWSSFFSTIGVVQKCDLFSERQIGVKEIEKIQGIHIKSYLAELFTNNKKGKSLPQSRIAFDERDILYQFTWFPYIEKIMSVESYRNFFWKQILEKKAIVHSKTSFHADHGKAGQHEQPETYLQFIFRTNKYIQDQTGSFHYAQDLYAPSMTYQEKPLKKTAQLPVVLPKEMENFFGFKSNISLEDCYAYLLEQCDDLKFDYSFYSFVMRHLLNNLKKSHISEKSWKFLSINRSWQEPKDLKYWGVSSSTPPQNDTHWIEPISSFSKVEMQEFCNYFKISQITDYTDSVQLERATPDDTLEKFIQERMMDILFSWKQLNGVRKISDCYEHIVLKLNALTFRLLPADTFSEGQVFCKGRDFFYSIAWEDDKKSMAKILGEYLGFTDKEMDSLKRALSKCSMRHYEIAKFNKFKEDFNNYKPPGVSGKEKAPITTPPDSPRASLRPFPLDLDTKLNKTINASPTSLFTPSKIESAPTNKSPPPTTPKNKTPLTSSSPSPEQPTRPSSQGKLIPKSGTTPTRSPQLKNGSGEIKNSPKKELTEDERTEKKRVGNWAENHVMWNLTKKYQEKYPKWQMEKLGQGAKKFKKLETENVIDIQWNNDPENRPVGKEDDDLWDSGQPFDIKIIKKIDAVVKIKMIEVKGTRKSQIHFFLGSSEWKTLLNSNPKEFQIHVVTGVGTDSPCVTCYKDLLEKIRKNEFDYISKTEFSGQTVFINNEQSTKK